MNNNNFWTRIKKFATSSPDESQNDDTIESLKDYYAASYTNTDKFQRQQEFEKRIKRIKHNCRKI